MSDHPNCTLVLGKNWIMYPAWKYEATTKTANWLSCGHVEIARKSPGSSVRRQQCLEYYTIQKTPATSKWKRTWRDNYVMIHDVMTSRIIGYSPPIRRQRKKRLVRKVGVLNSSLEFVRYRSLSRLNHIIQPSWSYYHCYTSAVASHRAFNLQYLVRVYLKALVYRSLVRTSLRLIVSTAT